MLSKNSIMLGRGSLIASARESLGRAICVTLEELYSCKIDENGLKQVSSAINQPPAKAEVSATELGLPTMSLRRFKPKDPNAPKGVKPNVMKESEEIAMLLQQRLGLNLSSTDCTNAIFQDFRSKVAEVSAVGSYLNFSLRPSFLGSIVDDIVSGDFVKPMPQTQPKVMVEFSQPNTHKAFHVGHMRNVALGDAVSRIYSMLGFQVTAANYFGDEGAHVAKCLWLVEKEMSAAGVTVSPEDDDETVSTKVDQALKIDLSNGDNRAEALGKRYADATDLLALDAYTAYPGAKGLIAAKVLSKAPHDTNPKWNVVQLQIGPDPTNQATVVCGGLGYNVDDVVAYAPVGIKFNKKAVIPMPMQGITSCGIMAAYKECGTEAPADVIERTTAVLVKEQEAAAAALAAAAPAPAAPVAEAAAETGSKSKKQKKSNKKGGNKKNKEGGIEDMLKKQIFLVSSAHSVTDNQLGVPVTEFGRMPNTDLTDLSRTVEEQIAERVSQTGEMLQRLESGEPVACRLWDVTKQWSLDEFHSIYNWLGAHFDVDFFESTVSHESKQMCLEYFKQGLLKELEGGAIGADLGKLGVLVLIKSNGTGLYATKDIALAKRKFEEFGVDRSIYVVDSSQMLHFQQLFKTLEMVGFEQASRCAHLKYGQVVLPDGKMSSRKGNVVFFSDLKEQLTSEILRDFMFQYTPEGAKLKSAETGKDEPVWEDKEIATSTQRIAVATIRYRMLNNDPIKTIEFDLAKWSAKSGNTGPYLMYTLCRAKSILRKVPAPEGFAGKPFDVSHLSTNKEWGMLMMLSEFWTIVNRASGLAYDNDPNPGHICMYAYELSSMYMSWVQVTSVINAQSDGERMARLMLVEAVAKVLKACLNVIGIEDIERM